MKLRREEEEKKDGLKLGIVRLGRAAGKVWKVLFLKNIKYRNEKKIQLFDVEKIRETKYKIYLYVKKVQVYI